MSSTDHRYIEFTKEQLDALGKMYLAGQSTHKLAKRYGISATTVGRRLEAMGISLRPLRENRTVTAEVMAQATKMLDRGETWRSIEKQTGVRPQSIMRVMRVERQRKAAE